MDHLVQMVLQAQMIQVHHQVHWVQTLLFHPLVLEDLTDQDLLQDPMDHEDPAVLVHLPLLVVPGLQEIQIDQVHQVHHEIQLALDLLLGPMVHWDHLDQMVHSPLKVLLGHLVLMVLMVRAVQKVLIGLAGQKVPLVLSHP